MAPQGPRSPLAEKAALVFIAGALAAVIVLPLACGGLYWRMGKPACQHLIPSWQELFLSSSAVALALLWARNEQKGP